MSEKLGQHFLQSIEKLNTIANSLDLKENENLIEVGPGHGELTGILLNSNANVFAVEKDDILTERLKETFKDYIKKSKLTIISGDILDELDKIVVNSFHSNKYKIVGNIPYYITGYLMRLIGNMENKPIRSVFLIQKEVAERICSKDGKTSLLSASIGFWADSKIIEEVDRKYFSPPPKVDSAIITIDLITDKHSDKISAEKYYKFIKILFKHPRKTIKNNLLEGGYDETDVCSAFQKVEYNNAIRAHQISVDEIVKLAMLFN